MAAAEELKDRFITAFKTCDSDGSGEISQSELKRVLQKLGRYSSDEQCTELFDSVDADKSGHISLDEFMNMMEDNFLKDAVGGGLLENGWIAIQHKTFTRWANNVLSERMIKVESLVDDIKDGLKLHALIELLAEKTLPKVNQKPKMKLHKLENLNKCINFLTKEEGLKLVNIGAEDLEGGDVKIVLGLIWTLILHYQISGDAKEGSPKYELLQWVKAQCKPYGIGQELTGFKKGWSDGKVVSALTDSLGPGCINMDEIDEMGPYESTQNAMVVAEDKFYIPKVMDSIDLVESPEEHSIMTYVSYFRDYLKNLQKRQLTEIKASECIAYGPGLEGGLNNTTLAFTCEAKNCFGTTLEKGYDEWAFVFAGPDDTVIVNTAVGEAGKLECDYSAVVPGDYELTVTWNDQPIKDGGVYNIHIDGPCAAKCTASGPGVEGGDMTQPAVFTVQAVDGNGNVLANGGDTFECVVTNPDGSEQGVALNDNGDGTYGGVYETLNGGAYKIDITNQGEPIAGSQFTAVMENANAAQSYAEGPGLEQGHKTGEDMEFIIIGVQSTGQPSTEGGDDFAVAIAGPNGDVQADMTDNGDGTYGVKYDANDGGDYTINVTLRGDAIKDMPVAISVKAAPDASNSYVEGEGLEGAFDNQPAYFTVFAFDKTGAPVSGDECLVTMTPDAGGEEADMDVVDNEDGTYSVAYQAAQPGAHTLIATLDGVNVKNVPVSILVKEGADCGNTDATSGIFKFTIHAQNQHGQPKSEGGDEFSVTIVTASGMPVDVATEDIGDGSYSATYCLGSAPLADDESPDEPREFNVNVMFNGTDIKGSPFKQMM